MPSSRSVRFSILMHHSPDGTTGSPSRSCAVGLIAIVTHSREPAGLGTRWWYIRAPTCPPILPFDGRIEPATAVRCGASRGGTRETYLLRLLVFANRYLGSQICTKLGVLSSAAPRQEIWPLPLAGMSISAAVRN